MAGVSRARAVLAAVPLLALALALGGCSGDPKPKFEPTPSVSASASASATAAPVMPDAARGTDAAAAEAFVRFYWDTVNYAQATGDVEALRPLASPECAPCRAGVAYLERVVAKGGRITGGRATVKVKRSSLMQGPSGNDAAVKIVLTTTPQVVDYPQGADEHYPGGTRVVNAFLKPSGGSWLMSTWGEEK